MLLVLRSLFFFSNLFNTWKVLVVSIKGAELGGQLFCCKRELSAFYVVPYFIHLNYQPYHLANFFVAQIPIYSCFLYFLVASWRVKETERMIAICTELRKVSVLLIPLWFRYYWTFYISLTYYCLGISARSNSWRRSWLLCDYSTWEIECHSYRHIWWPQNGHGILSCCLWGCSSNHQGSWLHQEDISRLLWSPWEVHKALSILYIE